MLMNFTVYSVLRRIDRNVTNIGHNSGVVVESDSVRAHIGPWKADVPDFMSIQVLYIINFGVFLVEMDTFLIV